MCSVSDAPTAQLIRLLHRHVFPETAVDHTVGVTAPTAGGEHTTRQTRPVIVHVIQTRALVENMVIICSALFYEQGNVIIIPNYFQIKL